MEQNEDNKSSVLTCDLADLLTRRPGHQMSLGAVTSCAVTDPKHRYECHYDSTDPSIDL